VEGSLRQEKRRDYVGIARRYAQDVVSGKIAACKWTIRACRRQLDDLEKAKSREWPYRFDREKASRICRFIEKLPHIKGKWAKEGGRIRLEPWQVFILTAVFGWVNRRTSLRRFRIVYIEVPRKNGKSTFSAGVGIYCACADGEEGAEVYSAATTRDQAKIVWNDAHHMVERSPGLKSHFGVTTSAFAISQLSTASRFQALSAEGNSLDGLNIHCAIVDELHAHRTRKVYDVLETATGARTQPLIWNITTAGSDRSGICYEQRTYLTKILEGTAPDDTYFGIIYSLDDEDDWSDPAVWAKANPNYGVSVFPDDMERLCLKARQMTSAQANFRTKRLSVWVNADQALFDMEAWNRCFDQSLKEEDFRGEGCWIAVDLAPRHDFCSLVKLFRRGDDYYCFAKHYLSDIEVEESSNAQFQGWRAEGWITTNPGNVNDYGLLEDELREAAKIFQIREVPYDDYSAHQFCTRMQEEGFPMVNYGATVKNFNEPTKLLEALIKAGKIHHNGDPVLAWMMSNVIGHFDRKDNVFPVKDEHQRGNNMTDGAIALIMTLGRAMVEEDSGSVYDNPEPVWIEE
jgi:phage terminase large subunit-like protein